MKVLFLLLLIVFPYSIVYSQSNQTYTRGFKIYSPAGLLYHRDTLILSENKKFVFSSNNYWSKKNLQKLDGSELEGIWIRNGDTLILKPENQNLKDFKYLIRNENLYQIELDYKAKKWRKAKP